jgi:hypothetical protein
LREGLKGRQFLKKVDCQKHLYQQLCLKNVAEDTLYTIRRPSNKPKRRLSGQKDFVKIKLSYGFL